MYKERKKLGWILLLSLILAACKKEKNITPSYWKIDGTEYSSDDVTKAIGKAMSAMSGRKDGSRFEIIFYWPYFPKDGKYGIVPNNPEQQLDKVVFTVYRGDAMYKIAPGEDKLMEASGVDGRSKYIVPLSWYINRSDSTDSVQIEGVFFEP